MLWLLSALPVAIIGLPGSTLTSTTGMMYSVHPNSAFPTPTPTSATAGQIFKFQPPQPYDPPIYPLFRFTILLTDSEMPQLRPLKPPTTGVEPQHRKNGPKLPKHSSHHHLYDPSSLFVTVMSHEREKTLYFLKRKHLNALSSLLI